MARKQKEVEIDGLRYRVRQVGGMDGLRLKARVTQVLGEPIAMFFVRGSSIEDFFNLDLEDEEDREQIVAAIRVLVQRITPEGLVELMRLMAFGNVQFKDRTEAGTEWIHIDDDETFAEAVGRSNNPLHDVNLLVACLSQNLLPTSPAAPIDPTSRSEQVEAGGPQTLPT